MSHRRSTNDFLIISESKEDNKVKIIEGNLYYRKLRKLYYKHLSRIAIQKYCHQLFLAPTGKKSWSHEDNFSKERVRCMIIAMATNQAYLRINRTNPFHYQKFNLSQFVVYRNGQPIDGTSDSTTLNHHIYFNTLEALNFLDKVGHGIPLDDYTNHLILAFDLTATQQASHDFIHPELFHFTFISGRKKLDVLW